MSVPRNRQELTLGGTEQLRLACPFKHILESSQRLFFVMMLVPACMLDFHIPRERQQFVRSQTFLCVRLHGEERKRTHAFPLGSVLRLLPFCICFIYTAELFRCEHAEIAVGQADVSNGYAQQFKDA